MLGTFGYPKQQTRTLLVLYYTYCASIYGLTIFAAALVYGYLGIRGLILESDFFKYSVYYISIFSNSSIMLLASLCYVTSAYYAFENRSGTRRLIIICLILEYLSLAITIATDYDTSLFLPFFEKIGITLFLVFFIFYTKYRIKKGYFTA